MYEFEIYFSDLNEEAQKDLLDKAGIKDPEDANWDIFPIATIQMDSRLQDEAEEIMQDYLDGNEEDMIRQLKALHEKGDVTETLYNYIIENWDNLLEIKEDN